MTPRVGCWLTLLATAAAWALIFGAGIIIFGR